MKIEAGRKLQETKKTEKGDTIEENIIPTFFKVLDKASQDLCQVTAHLHGLSLRKVWGQVLESSLFEKGDQDKVFRATCLLSQYLFVGKLPDGEGFQSEDSETVRAKKAGEDGWRG